MKSITGSCIFLIDGAIVQDTMEQSHQSLKSFEYNLEISTGSGHLVNAADLRPLNATNEIMKFADDT